MNKILLATLLTVLLTLLKISAVFAGTFEEFKQQQLQQQQQQKQQFTEFKNAQDAAFYSFLKKNWKNYPLKKAKPESSIPKPKQLPKIKQSTAPSGKTINFKSDSAPIAPKVTELKLKKQPSTQVSKHSFTFLKQTIRWQIPLTWTTLGQDQVNRLSPKIIANFWKDFTRLNSIVIRKQLNHTVKQLKLNDWGKLLLLQAFLKSLSLTPNQQTLTAWATLLKDDSDVRLGYANHQAYLLYNTKQKLFDTASFRYDGKNYYLFNHFFNSSKSIKRLSSYSGNLSKHPKPLNLKIITPPLIKKQRQQRSLAVTWKNQRYVFKVPVYKSVINYLATLPQQRLKSYFEFQPDNELSRALINQLRQATKGMNTYDKVNFLLRFSQTAFNYATDEQQFKQENYLLPNETLFYPASDCEDRSIFFAWLVRSMTKLPMVALVYPGHVATAVALPATKSKSNKTTKKYRQYNYRGKTYAVADPTYVNASTGMEMPQMQKHKPKLIALHNF